jgi:glycosyltransferase involved in cell wall biosynthesis
MSAAPRVTVAIPTYNRPQWLAGAIDSVLAQTFEDFVLEIHDDATPGPGVRDVVAGYDDPRVRLVEHEQNVGIVGNFARSLLAASGEYVLQLGDDDEMHPELLAATVEALDRFPSAGVAHTRFDLIDTDGTVTQRDVDWTGNGGNPPLERGSDFRRASMRFNTRICTSTALIRRSAVPPGGFLQEDFPPFDLACWLRMAPYWDFAFVPRTLCRYRIHPGSWSAGVSGFEGTSYVHDTAMHDAVYDVKRRYAGHSRRLMLMARVGQVRTRLAGVRHRLRRRVG